MVKKKVIKSHNDCMNVINSINEFYITKPQHNINTLVLYLVINPRSMTKTFIKLQTQVMNHLAQLSSGKLSDFKMNNIMSTFEKYIHSSIAEKPYIEIDIDTKDMIIVENIRQHLQPFIPFIICTIETNGGYHVIFKINKVSRGNLYKVFTSEQWKFNTIDRIGNKVIKKYVDIRSDPCSPIPGTLQGGFKVKFLYNFW